MGVIYAEPKDFAQKVPMVPATELEAAREELRKAKADFAAELDAHVAARRAAEATLAQSTSAELVAENARLVQERDSISEDLRKFLDQREPELKQLHQRIELLTKERDDARRERDELRKRGGKR